jgi:hypothetical protein
MHQRVRGGAPQTGRDPSTPLGATEKAIARMLLRLKRQDTEDV